MMKKILAVLASVSLTVSAFSTSVFAAPTAVTITDSDNSLFEENYQASNEVTEYESEYVHTGGPLPVLAFEPTYDDNTDFGTPELSEEAFLFAELSGEGTEESPYLINTKEDLILLSNNINTGIGTTAYYKLTADIDMGGAEWTPIGHITGSSSESSTSSSSFSKAFCGHFDGAGNTVSNFVITKDSTAYLGFFGVVHDGASIKNLNLDNITISVTSDSKKLFVGTLASRVSIETNYSRAEFVNCHVSNVSITAKSSGTIYAGGIFGSVTLGTSNGTEVLTAFSSAQCNIDISTNSLEHDCVVSAGGIAGYYGTGEGGTVSAINCHTNVNIRSVAEKLCAAYSGKENYATAMGGGMFGNLRSQAENILDAYMGKGGSIYINSCYSEGTVYTFADYNPYVAGGFAGQILPTNGSLHISDCYSSVDISGEYVHKKGFTEIPEQNVDPTAGGFVGQIMFFYYTNTSPAGIINCYASGDVVDLTHTPESGIDTSFVGGFTAFSDAGTFKNCYRLSSQLRQGSDLLENDYQITELSDEEAKLSDCYVGFDFDKTWEIDSTSGYPYPVLREKSGFVSFVSDDKVVDLGVFGDDGKVSAPSVNPTKAPTIDLVFNFNYWSLSENGSAFNFASDTVSENTKLYAVYTSSPRKYTLSFVSEGLDFVAKQSLEYGSAVRVPSGTPEKNSDDTFYYNFLHWSNTPNGNAYDFNGAKLYGDMTFYAVFDAVEKSAWTGDVAEKFSSGFGTKELPYVISTGEEFALFAKVINQADEDYVNAYYVLGDDINLGKNMWVPIGNSIHHPFSANFDGKGYTVKNFKVVQGQYGGLFGVILNGKVKNVYVKDFDISYTVESTEKDYPVFAGGVAGYVISNRGTSEISGVRVSALNFNLTANTDYAYVGNIAGYASASISGRTNITDSFATSPITVKNSRGYNYVGGIVGRLDTGSGSLSLIERCYNIGTLNSTSYHSSRAGGLVGYIYSYGSAFAPEVGSVSKDNDANLSSISDEAELFASDTDIMIKNSFAIASATSKCTGGWDSRVGNIAGEINSFAAVENVFYPRSAGIVLNGAVTNISGVYSTLLTNLKSASYLSSSLGFDFDDTWTFVGEYDYPVLKSMVSDKPLLKIVSLTLNDGVLSASVQALSDEDNYIVVIGVFNARNQLLHAERKLFTDTDTAVEFDVSYDGMEKAHHVTVAAVEKTSLKPLFEDVTKTVE